MTGTDADGTGLVLVTGAAGFIGKHVVRALVDNGYRVAALQHRTALPGEMATLCERVTSGDICDAAVRRAALDQADAVCHLSAYAPARMDDLHEANRCNQINALGAVDLAEEAAQRGVRRFVHVSAANMYAHGDSPRGESDAVFPSHYATAYLTSKLASEIYLSNIAERTDMELLILRVATPYGPGEPAQRVIPTFLRLAAEGKPLRVADGGVARFSYVHVADVATSVLGAVGSGAGGIYNIASGEHTSVLELAQRIVAMQGATPDTLQIGSASSGSFQGFAPVSIEKAYQTWRLNPRPLAVGLREYRDYLVDRGEIA
jgi:UDP-glucose 4-epimerase